MISMMTNRPNSQPAEIRSPAEEAKFPPVARNPLLLVHGLTDTRHKMRKIASHLRGLGWEVYDIDLKPNNGDAKLEVLAQQVADLVERTFDPHQQIDMLGFSMGGLVSRYYIQRLGGITRKSARLTPQQQHRVQRLITIASPHNGTISAYFSLRPGCVQMRPESEFILDLNRDVDSLNQLNFTSLWTPFDLMILPPSSSQLGIGTELMLPVLAHPLMVFDRRCLDAIAHALAQPVKSPI
jgi:triacylglycerol lipase